MADEQQISVPPVPIAFLLCDAVITDATTGKKTLVGVFRRIWSTQFPANHPSCALYFLGGDAEGEFQISVQYVKEDTQEVLAEAKATLRNETRGALEFSIGLPPIPIPGPGAYEFRLFMNEQYVHRIRFDAELQPPNR